MDKRILRAILRLSGQLLLGVVLTLAALFVAYRPDRAIDIGTASVSQVLCEQIFIAGLDPQRVIDEEIRPRQPLHLLLRRLHERVDRRR